MFPIYQVEVFSCIFHILPNVPADAKNSFAFVVDFFFFLANLLSNLIIAVFPLKSRNTAFIFLENLRIVFLLFWMYAVLNLSDFVVSVKSLS